MANLKITIEEKLVLEGVDRGTSTIQNITDINSVDNRVLSCPSESYTSIFSFNSSSNGGGTFTTGSFKYGRVTNKSSVPIKLFIKSTATSYNTFVVDSYSSFFISSTKVSASFFTGQTFTFNDYISEVSVQPSGSAATIEYFIAH
jgi:hypothetical protein